MARRVIFGVKKWLFYPPPKLIDTQIRIISQISLHLQDKAIIDIWHNIYVVLVFRIRDYQQPATPITYR